MSKAKRNAIELDEKNEDMRLILTDNNFFAGDKNVALTIFAASIGLKFNKFEPTEKVKFTAALSVGPIEEYKAHANFIAFQKNGDKAVLNNQNECWEIVSGFANGGLQMLKEWYDDVNGDISDFEKHIVNEMSESIAEYLPEQE